MASRLFSNFLTVGGATLISRVLGFVRDTMIAAELGTGPVADAFFVAFRLPNLFRRLFAEGAFNSAFVPLYARTLEGEGEAAARTFARDTFGMLVLSLAAVSAVAMIGAPWLVGLLAPGFGEEPAKFDLTVFLTRICFPYLACMSLTGLFGGILNSHGRFKAAAFAPVLLNVVLIAVLVGIAASGQARTSQAGVILSWGVAAAGLAQLLLVVVAVMRGGWGFVRGGRAGPRRSGGSSRSGCRG
ncbi:lipid II flippase MurJ [Methyloraptor flagellatus]|uniref:Lipid II flippase MurJ n=1 Tax=Methyloraptor flagellatus TaxID=3162530 RepID=A0AAU7X7W2_9HYPH